MSILNHIVSNDKCLNGTQMTHQILVDKEMKQMDAWESFKILDHSYTHTFFLNIHRVLWFQFYG